MHRAVCDGTSRKSAACMQKNFAAETLNEVT